ncbi:arginase family protein [Rhizobium ruizarguesonis]|uniref:arginase family protein n=1 Tax=Rhizobium ruizarguesonis TaxID=2081791 RepID=UPI0037228208
MTGIGVCSISFDGTASTRIGARDGPGAIRRSSLSFSTQVRSRDIEDFIHMGNGARLRLRSPEIVDFGDLHVFPTDVHRQLQATACEVFEVTQRSELAVILGGEHTISYPAFVGVAESAARRGRNKIGYVQIDNHFDFGASSILHGAHYHGSNARRIAEYLGMDLQRLGFVGQGDITSLDQFESLRAGGCAIRNMNDVRTRGYETCLREVLDAVTMNAPDGLYVSIDIDVCDCSVAPGTGHVTIGGLKGEEFIATARILQSYPLRAVDIVEVNPSLDPSGRTAFIAARFLYELLLLDWKMMSEESDTAKAGRQE